MTDDAEELVHAYDRNPVYQQRSKAELLEIGERGALDRIQVGLELFRRARKRALKAEQ